MLIDHIRLMMIANTLKIKGYLLASMVPWITLKKSWKLAIVHKVLYSAKYFFRLLKYTKNIYTKILLF